MRVTPFPTAGMSWSYAAPTSVGTMTVLPLTIGRFSDMQQVFGEKGVARQCFCMHWRRPDGGFGDSGDSGDSGDHRDNCERFHDLVADDHPPGLLGYVDDAPVGWVQVGPRSDFPTLGRSRLFKPVDQADPWSINCFVVRVGHRREGVAAGLLAAAVEFAAANGAELIEAYPVDGPRQSAVDYFTGTMGMFTRAGFEEVARRNETRPVVRLKV